MPLTPPSNLPVARKDSSPGTVTENFSWVPSSEPTVKSENGASWAADWYSASAAAIFMGWTSVMILPCTSPLTATARPATSVTTAPSRVALRYIGRSLPTVARRMCHRPTHDDRPTDHVCRGDDVRERHQLHLVEHHRREVGELRTAGPGVVAVADRVLHERVGGEDEVRREQRADVDQPHAGRVQPLRQPAPAEDPQPQEGGLEEEREQGLDRQR